MVTMEQLRKALDAEEPNYDRAAELGPEALPHLRVLVDQADPLLASKAAYLAGRIDQSDSSGVVAVAAKSGHPSVRVAAAATSRVMSTSAKARVHGILAGESDAGIRRVLGPRNTPAGDCACTGALTVTTPAVAPKVSNLLVVCVSNNEGGPVRGLQPAAFQVSVVGEDTAVKIETVTERGIPGMYELRLSGSDDVCGERIAGVAVRSGDAQGRALGMVALAKVEQKSADVALKRAVLEGVRPFKRASLK